MRRKNNFDVISEKKEDEEFSQIIEKTANNKGKSFLINSTLMQENMKVLFSDVESKTSKNKEDFESEKTNNKLLRIDSSNRKSNEAKQIENGINDDKFKVHNVNFETLGNPDEFLELGFKYDGRINSITNQNQNLREQVANNENILTENFETIKFVSITNSEKIRQYIRFKEAWNYFISSDLDYEKSKIRTEDFSNYNCFQKMYLNCSKKLILNNELLDERKFVFCIAKVSFDDENKFHSRMLKTILQNFLEDNASNRNGDEWLKIGFQSEDPKSDLRSTGMFSILQVLSLIDNLNLYSKDIFISFFGENNLPLMCLLINISAICLEVLREGYLIDICNLKKSVIETLNEFFVGTLELFIIKFSNSEKKIDKVNSILEELKVYLKSNIHSAFQIAKNLFNKYPKFKDSMSLGEDNNSV